MTERNFPLRFLLMQRKAPAKRPETLENPGSAPEFGMDECPIPLQIPQKKGVRLHNGSLLLLQATGSTRIRFRLRVLPAGSSCCCNGNQPHGWTTFPQTAFRRLRWRA